MGICLSTETPAPQRPQDNVVMVERPPLVLGAEGSGAAPPVQAAKPKLRLSQVNPKSVPDVMFQNQVIEVFVYEVYDGDTLHFLLDIGREEPLKLALRLIGIDTPEIHAGKEKLPQEKVAGKIARDYLKTLVSGHTKVRISDWDKFGGRCLGEVVLADGQTANQMMIKGGYARPYHGEKKQPWVFEELTSAPFNVTSRDIDLFEEEN